MTPDRTAQISPGGPAPLRRGLPFPTAVQLPKAGIFLVAAATAGVSDTLLCALALSGDLHPVAAFAGHLALVAALVGWLYFLWRRGRPARLGTILAISTAFMGPVGVAGAVLMAMIHFFLSRHSTAFEDWYMSLFPEHEHEFARELYANLATGRESAGDAVALSSFSDILTFGTVEQKRAVIAVLAQNFRAELAPALTIALADADPAVRVQAATAAATIEARYQDRWFELRATAEADATSFVARLELARHVDDYAHHGVVESDRKAELRDLALTEYRRCLALDPDADEVRVAIGRLLVRGGAFEEAVDVLSPIIRDDDAGEAFAWYVECLFRLGRFSDLRAIAMARRVDGRPASRLASALAMWAEPKVAA
ncbi:MAG: hypothetical protein AB7N54_02295 [Alphaproteobacteria bacterium]